MQVNNLIIDGSNIEHRMFYISKKNKTRFNEDGESTGCILTFMQVFKNLVRQFKPDDVYVCWDKKLTWPSTNFRNELIDDGYKAGRVRDPDILEMYEQEPKIVEMLQSLGCTCMFPDTLEGDDIISWLAHTREGTNVIVSVDKDMLQLINERTSVYHPGNKSIIDLSNFKEVAGVEPKYFKLYKAIWGDTSDNIKGLPGYGKVRAKVLAENWETSNVIEDYRKVVERNLKVIDLDIGYNIPPNEVPAYERQMEEQKAQACDLQEFKRLCEEHKLTQFLNKFTEWQTIFSNSNIASLIENYFKDISN